MKHLQVYDDDHTEVKAHAAKAGQTIPKTASAFIRFVSDKLNSGELRMETLIGPSEVDQDQQSKEAS